MFLLLLMQSLPHPPSPLLMWALTTITYVLVYCILSCTVDGLVRKLHGSAVNDYGYTPCLHIVVDIAETTMTMWTLAVGLGLEGELPKSNIRNRIAKTKKTKVRKMC